MAKPKHPDPSACPCCDAKGTQFVQSYQITTAGGEQRWYGLYVPCPFCDRGRLVPPDDSPAPVVRTFTRGLPN